MVNLTQAEKRETVKDLVKYQHGKIAKYLKAAKLAILCTMRNVCLMPKVAVIVQDEAKPTVAGDVPCSTKSLCVQQVKDPRDCVECRVCTHLGPKVAMLDQKMCPLPTVVS